MKTKTLSAPLLAVLIAALSLTSTSSAQGMRPGCQIDPKTGRPVCGPVIAPGGTGPFHPASPIPR